MNKIIVGFDGTDQARDALNLGAALARVADARLLVASAIEFGPLELEAMDYNEARDEHYARVFGQARAELGDAEFDPVELQDTAAHGLTDLAEREGAEAIVIGSTHHGSIGRVLAGTVASRLLHGAPCAVLVAPRGWSEHEHLGIGLIGIAYDGSDESRLALALAERLARAFDAELRIIAVAPFEGAHAEPVREHDPTWAARLDQAVASVSDDVEVEGVLREGREASELALQGVEVDLLVVGSRGYGPVRRALIGSVAGELVRTAPCPVMVVPRGARSEAEAAG
jgi:nucleotide-binding universal stress UspA family protein